MTATAFVAALQSRGALLEVEAGRLRVTPAAALTDNDRAAWRQFKPEILSLLWRLSPAQRERANQCVTGEAMMHAARCVGHLQCGLMPDGQRHDLTLLIACLNCGVDVEPRGGA